MPFSKTYTSAQHSVTLFPAIYQAMVFNGFPDADVALAPDGDLSISSESATGADEATFDAAVGLAADGDLFHNKAAKIVEVEAKTRELIGQGIETWEAGKFAALSKTKANNYITDVQYYTDNPAKLTAASRYLVYTLDGRAVLTDQLADIQTLADNAVDRLVEIYTAVPGGEIDLITSIAQAIDQAALDAITDART